MVNYGSAIHPFKLNLGQKIKNRRKKLKMTQDELGASLGVSKSAIVQIEKGISSPTIDKFPQMMATLKVDANFLLMDSSVECDVDYVEVHKSAFDAGVQEGLKRAERAIQTQLKGTLVREG